MFTFINCKQNMWIKMSVVEGEFQSELRKTEKSLFSPAIDFMFLGGGYLVILLPIVLFFPRDEMVIAQVSITFLFLANFINHPHFAHSYHIFYRDFFAKFYDTNFALRNRFIFAGFVVPLMLISFFTYCLFSGEYKLLGYGGNAMVFFTGWHYVKQGYGMLMVSSVLKRSFYNELEKKIFLINSYIVWGFSWLYANRTISERELWGVEYFAFSVPSWTLWIMGIGLTVSSILAAGIFIRHCRKNYEAFPKNGAVAYITSLYVWLIVLNIHPVLAFIIPAFHSAQYLIVVWRYEINRSIAEFSIEKSKNPLSKPIGVQRRLFNFALFGVVAGCFGFWLTPLILDSVTNFDLTGLSPTAFIFMFWVFINIHHYFIDNVIWRRENTDVSKYLFS